MSEVVIRFKNGLQIIIDVRMQTCCVLKPGREPYSVGLEQLLEVAEKVKAVKTEAGDAKQ